MVNKKSQAALEFLTTYGWAFIVILVAISALYYFGIFDFAQYLPQKCAFPIQFECRDFSLRDSPAGDADIRFKLYNNIGENIRVVNVTVTNDIANPLTCTLDAPIIQPGPAYYQWSDDEELDFEFSDCQDGLFVEGQRIDVLINFTYFAEKTPSKPRHVVRGKIIGIVG